MLGDAFILWAVFWAGVGLGALLLQAYVFCLTWRWHKHVKESAEDNTVSSADYSVER